MHSWCLWKLSLHKTCNEEQRDTWKSAQCQKDNDNVTFQNLERAKIE